jgi:NAD(P)-dependent dehydrogenase (short-subunit alcohol dehydrogenase family)
VSSTFGFFAAADVIGYATSKFGVFGLTESLRGELAPHGIGVSVVCPGVVATDIIAGTRFAGDGEDAAARRSRAASLFSERAYGPEKVARAILHAIERNTSVAPVSPEAWALYYLKRIAPAITAPLGRFLTRQATR